MIKLDHVIIAVEHLTAAKAATERLGFNVVFGGDQRSAVNALIFLEDGTLIELVGKDRLPRILTILRGMGVTRWFGPMIDRIAAFRTAPAGLFNVSLHSDDLGATCAALRRAGIAAGRPIRLRRRRDDGVAISWRLVGSAPFDLPFFIGEYSPSRLSDPRHVRHSNGAVGVAKVKIGCLDLQRYADLYRVLLDTRESETEAYRVAFRLGETTIELIETQQIRPIFSARDQSFPIEVSLRFSTGETHALSVSELAARLS